MAAMKVKLDFDNAYKIKFLSEDFRESLFRSELQDGSVLPLKIEISLEPHELLPGVFNLAFGPLDAEGKIDDKVAVHHKDYSRVFSSILSVAFTYLQKNRDSYLGVDGSNNARAYLYYRFLQRNYDYLDKFFEVFGLKYYVRISRFGKTQYENPFDFDDIQPGFEKIRKNMTIRSDFIYNYLVFRRKN